MRRTCWLGLCGIALAVAGPAAAVPLAHPQRFHLRSIIEMPALANFFPINRMELIAPNVWRVTAGHCHIDVRLRERRGAYPGRGLLPPQIEPRPGRRVCARQGGD